MEIYEKVFIYLTYLWYLFFVLAYFKLWEPAQTYYDLINFYYIFFIALTLIIRFNPIKYYKVTQTTRQMVFSAGISLLLLLGFSKIIKNVKQTGDKIMTIQKMF